MGKKKKIKMGGSGNMKSTVFHSDKFSLSEFVKENKRKIDSITPRNPSIKKDDEWRDPSYDEFYRRVTDK